MKRDKDWTDVMRDALRDAELPPPAGVWERLRRELPGAAPQPEVHAAGPRRSVWRIYGPRVAAAAAVIACIVAGGRLFRPEKAWIERSEIATAVRKGSDTVLPPAEADPALPPAEAESVREALARSVGLSAPSSEPSSAAGSSLLAAKTRPAEAGAESSGADAAAGKAARMLRMGGARSADAATTEAAGPENALARPAAAEASKNTKTAERRTADDARAASASAGQTAAGLTAAGRTRSAEQAAERAGSAARPHASERSGAEHSRARRPALRSAAPAVADEPFVARRRPRSRASFALFGGGGVSGSGGQMVPLQRYSSVTNDVSSVVGKGDQMAPLYSNRYGESSFRHHQPLSFGLSVGKEFAYGLSLESGVIYTLLRSDVRAQYSSEDVSQKLHFIGVPLRLNWQFLERGRFSMYVGAGGMAEKCISAKFGSKHMNETGVQWSALAAVGAQYRLGGLVAFYFEPEGSLYFTDTELRTSRTDSPLTLTLRLGVRLSF